MNEPRSWFWQYHVGHMSQGHELIDAVCSVAFYSMPNAPSAIHSLTVTSASVPSQNFYLPVCLTHT